MRNEQVRKKWYREEAPIKQYPRANTCASNNCTTILSLDIAMIKNFDESGFSKH